MLQNDRHRLEPGWAAPHFSRYILGGIFSFLCASGALGQVAGADAAATRLAVANDHLKTCLQRHYEPGRDQVTDYRSGDELIAACRNELDMARLACMAQFGKTREYCDAQTKIMLLGFVPMH